MTIEDEEQAHILVVEDDATTRYSFVQRLRYAGYQVSEAPDGETALDLLEAHPFDVVITDIIMGAVDGMEVLHTARLGPAAPEVILLTGHGSFDTAVQAVREGAYDYLVKPCSGEHLLACVARAVQRHRSEQQVREAAQTLLTALYGETAAALPLQADTAPTQDKPPPVAITVGDLVVGGSRTTVTFQGQAVRLTPIEFRLLRYLAEHAGQVCYSRDIVRTTHGFTLDDTEAQALVKPHIYHLRRKINPDYLLTERAIGYRLVNPADDLA